ncbi:MAG: CAP domain-containing protein [Granulosicoccus sp.]|nr:CAP domain-containing protein [Granulosicoccus sp.]
MKTTPDKPLIRLHSRAFNLSMSCFPAPLPNRHSRLTLTLLGSFALLLSSCGTGGPALAPVDGSPDESPTIAAANPETAEQSVDTVEGTASPGGAVNCSAVDSQARQQMLDLINAVRAEARSCGADYFEAGAALSWNAELQRAAQAHSDDMAVHNFFDHTGSDGSSIGQRATSAAYRWSSVGENISAGQSSAALAVDAWVNSPGHCRNLMNPVFTDVALACAEDPLADYTYYWTNVLATPR